MKCEICEQTVESVQGLARHLAKSHKEIIPQEYYDKYILVEGEDRCKNPVCNKKPKFNNFGQGYKNNVGEDKYCSISCSRSTAVVQNKQSNTCLEKHGNANYRNNDKYKETCLINHGAENVLSKGTVVFNKKNKTIEKKYGVGNVFQATEVKDKIRSTHEELGHWSTLK